MTARADSPRDQTDESTPPTALAEIGQGSGIPPLSSTPAKGSVTSSDGLVPHALGSAIRQVLNRFELSTGTELPKVIAVTAALRGEGVTTISRALASVLASDFDTRVCWIDLSFEARRSSRGDRPIEATADSARGELIATPDPRQPEVELMTTSHALFQDRHRLARSPELASLFEDVTNRFDFVVLDTAPVLANSDALAMLRHAHAHILVTRFGATSTQQVREVAEELESVPMIGAILNQYQSKTPKFIRHRFAG